MPFLIIIILLAIVLGSLALGKSFGSVIRRGLLIIAVLLLVALCFLYYKIKSSN